MGVRGLTTFIAKNGDKYLDDYELNNTYLVIDGNNLAVQLYLWHAKCYDCFGGDYDQYAHAVRSFFGNLTKCRITPLVVFDGCYENKKLKTIYDRVRDRVSATRKLNAGSEGHVKVFPLFLRELFTEVVLSTGCKAVRCEFEADYEMACLAKTINSPVLSYDSDFYIFDVLYVPFNSLDLTPKIKKTADGKVEHYMGCKLYRIDNFLKSIGGMDKTVLPLLATVVGNDYIAASVFKEFYEHLKMVKKKHMDSNQQRKIESVIKWLLNETYESAARKILGRIKREHRQKLADQIEEVAQGYHCIESTLLTHFGLDANAASTSSITKEARRASQIDLSTIEDDTTTASGNSPETSTYDGEGEETKANVAEAPGELNLDKFQGHFPEWFVHQFRTSNFPAWFMDIAVHNRYFFIPQMENYEKPHSHTISLDLLAAMHKILRSCANNAQLETVELTYIAREGPNNVFNHQLQFSTVQLPTLNEIPGMSADELKLRLHETLDMVQLDNGLDTFLNKFDSDWRVFILGILYWAKNHPEVTKIHIYALILCAITLNIVDKQVGYLRTDKDAYRKLKNAPQYAAYFNFIRAVLPYFCMDDRVARNPKRYYEIYTIDAFARFQSALFHIKYLNKLLLSPYEDFLISDFYNGTFIYNVFMALKKRTDPLSYMKNLCATSMEIFNKFLQIAIEITCRLETNISELNKKPRKRKSRQKSGESNSSPECSSSNHKRENIAVPISSENEESTFDPNNPYSVLTRTETE